MPYVLIIGARELVDDSDNVYHLLVPTAMLERITAIVVKSSANMRS